jgi:hypothetical protein
MKARALLLCLFAALFMTGAVMSLQRLSSETGVQKNALGIMQGSGIIWNSTDFNTTITPQTPNLNVTIAPRIITEYVDSAIKELVTPPTQAFQISPRITVEYSDSLFQLGINAPLGLNVTGVTPRIMVEYADYETFIGTQPIPEFPSILILPLFMIVTLFSAIVYKKKRAQANVYQEN